LSIIALIAAAFWVTSNSKRHAVQEMPPSAARSPREVIPDQKEAPAKEVSQPEAGNLSAPATASSLGGIPQPVATAVAAAPAAEQSSQSAPQEPPPQSSEVRATRAMYMAHAPLRDPAVADPDSEENRQILQTMVEKALSRQEAAR
jgi:hypothetical protein